MRFLRKWVYLLVLLPVLVGCGKKNESKDKTDFETLMGRDQPAWQYVQTREDFENLNFFKTVYDQNISFLNAKSTMYRVPKVVHFIWIGPKPFPRDSVENIRSWIGKHPDWTFKFWTDRDRPLPHKQMQLSRIQDFQFIKLYDCYKKSDNYGEKSDILRYEILYQHGGIYVDGFSEHVTKDIVQVLQGIIILFVAAEAFFKWFYKVRGWTVGNNLPPEIKKCVMIVAPHTSGWDFVNGMGAKLWLNLDVRYLAKKELFKWPLKKMFVKFGGVEVDRGSNQGLTEAIIDYLNSQETAAVVFAAEGTRRRVTKWKKGFYYAAMSAKVPIVMSYIDYRKKEAGIGPWFNPSGDQKKDFAIIREFYSHVTPCKPENFALPEITG